MENNDKKQVSPNQIIFNVTDNIQKLGIKEFILQDKDFLITSLNGRSSCINFNLKSSLGQIIKLIKQTLKKEVKGILDDETVEDAIRDIEHQIINKRDEIYNLNKTKTSESNSADNQYKSNFLEDVSILRIQFEKSTDPYKEWQQEVKEKYNNLHEITIKHYPAAWPVMQFILSVKTILNIDNNKLPFLGIILAIPSSLKTTFINFFRKYINTFYSDSFTPPSFISHNSALNEDQLKEGDMIPKMKNKFVLTPELAPLFTAKDEDLQKILGIITRLLDGDGFESDSGAHGHRGYPPTMFSWIGAVVEIPPKIWKILSQLGFKIYFFRPDLPEKSIDDLVKIAMDSKISEKNLEIESALLEYLKVFDAAPITHISTLDENGIVKVKWNAEIETTTATNNNEQYNAIQFIAKIAKLLASLRGDVYVYQHKSRQSTKQDVSDGQNEEQISYQTEQLDYETDSVIIEDPSRATIQLRNLALANAISQGRNYIKIEDVRLLVKVSLSTTRITRKKVFELLLKEKGHLTTSKITKELDLSEPNARKTMREFQALGIANVSSTSGYANSELTLALNGKFKWFLSEEFQQLRDDKTTTTVTTIQNQSNTEYRRMYLPIITKTLSNSYYYTTIQQKKACDNSPCDSIDCHTLKANLPPEREIKIDNQLLDKYDDNKTKNSKLLSIKSDNDIYVTDKKITCNSISNNFANIECNKIENYKKHDETTDIKNIEENYNINDSTIDLNLQKNSASLGPENFQRVTLSHEKCHIEHNEPKPNQKQNIPKEVVEAILKIIRDEHGQIALNYALQLACQKSSKVKAFLKDEKLTARDSRKVRNIFVEINRHPNIKVVKKKPQLVVKWIEQEKQKEEKVLINN